MFDLSVEKNKTIKVIENGNTHEVPVSMTHWCINDLVSHWGFEIYELLDGYAVKYLFLNTIVDKEQGYLRAFRAVRTRNFIHFDDIRTAVPWSIRSWSPMESIEYALSSEGLPRINYSFDSLERIPEFSVSHEELSEYLYTKLQCRIPKNYDSQYKLYYT